MSKKPETKPTVSSDVLQALFENGKSPLSVQFIRWKLWKKWSDYVGQTTADVSEPVGYFKGTLFVWVKNSSWMQQLYFIQEQMLEAINQKLGTRYVTEIKFTMNRKKVPADLDESQKLRDSMDVIMNKKEI